MVVYDPIRRKILVGRERFGRYKGKFNICGGHVEPEDRGCALNAALRELGEEFKILASSDPIEVLLRHTMFVGTTPVFVAVVDSSLLPEEDLEAKMLRDVTNDSLPGTRKEMDQARWIPMSEAHDLSISRFAKMIIRKLVSRMPGS